MNLEKHIYPVITLIPSVIPFFWPNATIELKIIAFLSIVLAVAAILLISCFVKISRRDEIIANQKKENDDLRKSAVIDKDREEIKYEEIKQKHQALTSQFKQKNKMLSEYETTLNTLHSAINIALSKGDVETLRLLFDQCYEMQIQLNQRRNENA